MKFKKTLLSLGAITMVIAPVSSVIACGSKSQFVSDAQMAALNKHKFTHQNDLFDLSSFKTTTSLRDATIVSWIDGDTPIVTIDGGNLDKDGNPKEEHIRIAAIDTPEMHVQGADGKINVETVGAEKVWADKAQAFGQEVMPTGAKIKLFTSDTKSYERIVGSLFYLDDPKDKSEHAKYHNYSVEMLKRGLATALVGSVTTASNPRSILGLTGLALADAYNQALKTKQGLFGADIYGILGVHGISSDASLRWTGVKFDPFEFGSEKNMYDVLHEI